jgi:hypothetical protein
VIQPLPLFITSAQPITATAGLSIATANSFFTVVAFQPTLHQPQPFSKELPITASPMRIATTASAFFQGSVSL